jgi:tetratricopeptide (TPR) repeat protein
VWRPLAETIDGFEGRVPALAFGVVLFVAALACLTIADLTERQARVSNIALMAGLIAASGAVLAALTSDVAVWQPLLVVFAISLVLGAGFRALGIFKEEQTRNPELSKEDSSGETPHTPELELKQYGGAHLFMRHADNLRERVVIGFIALTVFVSSVVGYWYTQAESAATEATHHAFGSEAAITTLDGERWLLASAGAITPTLELFDARMRCAYASQASVLPPADASPTMLAMLARDRERDCGALDKMNETGGWVDSRGFDTGDRPAPAIFNEIHDRGPVNSSHLYALADGYVSQAQRLEDKSTWYILHLTLFAIALYLLGQSLGMGQGHASIALAFAGVIVTVVTFVGALAVHRTPAMPTPTLPASCGPYDPKSTAVELAAKFYGDGLALYNAATTAEQYQKASDLFGCAVAARKDFGAAQYERSLADSAISQGDIDSEYWNFPTRSRMAEIADSYSLTNKAIENDGWTPTPRRLNSEGFNRLLAGIAADDLAAIDGGIAILQRAIASGGLTADDGRTLDAVKVSHAPDPAAYQMLFTNLGLGQLARGNRADAERSYQAAVDGLSVAKDQNLVASSLSDLNTLEAHCAELYGSSAQAKCPDVYAGIADARRMLLLGKSSAPASSYAKISHITTWVRASRVAWSADVAGFDPSRDRLSVVWSTYSNDWKVWRVVQPLFQPIDPASLPATGEASHVTIYSNSPSYCLPPGTYREEFFLNGVRVPDFNDKGTAISGYQNFRSRELDVAFCGPADWQPLSLPAPRDSRQLLRLYKNADGKGVVYLFTFFSPKNPMDTETRYPVVRAMNLLRRLGTQLPSDEELSRMVSQFTGCQNPIPSGTILPRVWASTDGLVHVALVVGDRAPNGQACQVLESIGEYYGRTDDQLLGRRR